MEVIEKILYSGIQNSDFSAMNKLNPPETGGGQRYIELAKIDDEEIADFCSYAERKEKKNYTRYTYTFKAYVLGQSLDQNAEIVIDPRSGRNFRISNQTLKDKGKSKQRHPAWHPDNGFPKAPKSNTEEDIEEIIKNLSILIFRTNYHRYYATYVNQETFPEEWPKNIGLEEIFREGKNRGIVDLTDYQVEFKNNFSNPFGSYSKRDGSRDISYATGYSKVNGLPRNRIIFGAPGTGKSYRLNDEKNNVLKVASSDFERVTFYPDYTYAQFMGIYKPTTSYDGEIEYSFIPGPFLRILTSAYKNILEATDLDGYVDVKKIRPFLIIIEEINRAHAASVFGDLFQLLDRGDDNVSEYEIQINKEVREYLKKQIGSRISDSIKIPDNFFIWATMNSADQGVFPIDTAFKRRWSFEYIGIDDAEMKVEMINSKTGKKSVKENQNDTFNLADGKVEWNVLRRAINSKLSNDRLRIHEDKLLGPFFLKIQDSEGNSLFIDENKDDDFIKLFCEKVLMYLFEDAAKTKRKDLFEGCDSDKLNRFSYICTEFKEKGLGIFGTDFRKKEYAQQKKERDIKIRTEQES